MRDSYQPPRRDTATRIGTALRGVRTADFRHPSKRMWRAAQIGALATVGFVALFARSTPAQTASAQSPDHPPAAPGAAAAAPQSASAATAVPSPTLAPPAGVPAPAPSAAQTTSSGSSGAAGSGGDDDSGHKGRDGDGDGDD